jgi:signal transduction histidine kinase
MPDTALLRRRAVELGWIAFVGVNALAMLRWEDWETVPFHFIWVSLTLLYGFRVWRVGATLAVLGVVVFVTGGLIMLDIHHGTQQWGELTEVPLMSAMFFAMVWHARRRQQAAEALEALAASQASLLERQERFLHDASHELRTPVTIARGHLDLLGDAAGAEVAVALDELARIERIVDRLLLLAKADQPDFLMADELDLEPFLEDIFMRWSEVADRAWRLGPLPAGRLPADEEALRIALDALLENAVKYTEPGGTIEIGATARDGHVALSIADDGCGIPRDALERVFDRAAAARAALSSCSGGSEGSLTRRWFPAWDQHFDRGSRNAHPRRIAP